MALGPERQIRRFLVNARRFLVRATRAILAGARLDPAADAPGSESVAALNPYLKLTAVMTPDILQELVHWFEKLFAAFKSARDQRS